MLFTKKLQRQSDTFFNRPHLKGWPLLEVETFVFEGQVPVRMAQW